MLPLEGQCTNFFCWYDVSLMGTKFSATTLAMPWRAMFEYFKLLTCKKYWIPQQRVKTTQFISKTINWACKTSTGKPTWTFYGSFLKNYSICQNRRYSRKVAKTMKKAAKRTNSISLKQWMKNDKLFLKKVFWDKTQLT